jgi:MFS transporter, ACS family, solute carrier family 17 (sodium-dependent inorganic phosphate cotransporter), other
MMINSVFAFLVPIAAQKGGIIWLCVIRFIQGLGEGPIVSLFLDHLKNAVINY